MEFSIKLICKSVPFGRQFTVENNVHFTHFCKTVIDGVVQISHTKYANSLSFFNAIFIFVIRVSSDKIYINQSNLLIGNAVNNTFPLCAYPCIITVSYVEKSYLQLEHMP